MENPENSNVKALVEVNKGDLSNHAAFEVLSNVRSENVWLANFSSQNTRDAYQRSIASFIATIGIAAPDEIYDVKQAHVLAWRTSMEQSGLSQAIIANRLSALSSLYKHLTDQQLTASNPVAGVKRPKTGNAGIGAGKSPTLSKRQVRSMLDAPDIKTIKGLRDRAFLHIFFYAGARCSEPANLKVKDFGYDAEFPILNLTIKGGKTNSVAINLECAKAIREYLDATEHGIDADAYIFKPMKNGRPGSSLSRQQVYEIFKQNAVLAGMDNGKQLVADQVQIATLAAKVEAQESLISVLKDTNKQLWEEVVDSRGNRKDVTKISERMLLTLEAMALGGRLEPAKQAAGAGRSPSGEVIHREVDIVESRDAENAG